MANRDVGVSICGVVVGVMLGAGSVLYAQDATLSATSSDVAYRGVNFDARDYNARNVEAKQRAAASDINDKASRPVKRKSEEPSHEAAPVDLSACGVARAIVARMSDAINSTIPNEQTNNYSAMRIALGTVLSAVETDYCGSNDTAEVEEAAPMKKAAPQKKVDNDCGNRDLYVPGSRQHTLCLGNELEGTQYIGY
ncbi:MAG: hypothetical protein AAB489_00480 [Patescibacteria group bacterium]